MKYYYLKKGDIIQEGDECGTMEKYNDDGYTWKKEFNCIGQPAPDPQFMSHRKYRRLLADNLETCELCETIHDLKTMRMDDEGNWFCKACIESSITETRTALTRDDIYKELDDPSIPEGSTYARFRFNKIRSRLATHLSENFTIYHKGEQVDNINFTKLED